MIHSRHSNPDGSAIVVVDILCIKDVVFEEHWDVIHPEATRQESKSKLPMFGDSFPR
jgi:predicted SnoaL-like aldol condensation-catalyzing enzyme